MWSRGLGAIVGEAFAYLAILSHFLTRKNSPSDGRCINPASVGLYIREPHTSHVPMGEGRTMSLAG